MTFSTTRLWDVLMHEGVNDVRKGHINAPTDVVFEPEFVLSGLLRGPLDLGFVLLGWLGLDGSQTLAGVGVEDAHTDPVPAQSVGNLRDAPVRFGPVLDSEGATGDVEQNPAHDRQTAGTGQQVHLVHGGCSFRQWRFIYRARMVDQCLIDGVLCKAPAGFDREVKRGPGQRLLLPQSANLVWPFNPAPKHGGQFIQIILLISENDGRPLGDFRKDNPKRPEPLNASTNNPFKVHKEAHKAKVQREADEHREVLQSLWNAAQADLSNRAARIEDVFVQALHSVTDLINHAIASEDPISNPHSDCEVQVLTGDVIQVGELEGMSLLASMNKQGLIRLTAPGNGRVFRA